MLGVCGVLVLGVLAAVIYWQTRDDAAVDGPSAGTEVAENTNDTTSSTAKSGNAAGSTSTPGEVAPGKLAKSSREDVEETGQQNDTAHAAGDSSIAADDSDTATDEAAANSAADIDKTGDQTTTDAANDEAISSGTSTAGEDSPGDTTNGGNEATSDADSDDVATDSDAQQDDKPKPPDPRDKAAKLLAEKGIVFADEVWISNDEMKLRNLVKQIRESQNVIAEAQTTITRQDRLALSQMCKQIVANDQYSRRLASKPQLSAAERREALRLQSIVRQLAPQALPKVKEVLGHQETVKTQSESLKATITEADALRDEIEPGYQQLAADSEVAEALANLNGRLGPSVKLEELKNEVSSALENYSEFTQIPQLALTEFELSAIRQMIILAERRKPQFAQ